MLQLSVTGIRRNMLVNGASLRGAISATTRAAQRAVQLHSRVKEESIAPMVVAATPARLCSTKRWTEEQPAIQVEGVKNKGKQRAVREEPPMWREQLKGIEAILGNGDAGTFVDFARFPGHTTRFHVLIGGMLSSQTKEHVNAAALRRLIERGLTVQEMLDIDESEIAQIIRPVSFYNNKAKYIKQTAAILKEQANGADVIDIPDTYEALIALPGVGPKMATLVMSHAWSKYVGCLRAESVSNPHSLWLASAVLHSVLIARSASAWTHVHRIANRLKWVDTWNEVNPKSQNPEKTRAELEDWLPHELWGPINRRLVLFGQTTCLPRGPKCHECAIKHLCPSTNDKTL